jgi:hypothetical protein
LLNCQFGAGQLGIRPVKALSNVFNVTGDAIIDRVALSVECAIVMPTGVAIAIEGFANNRSGDVGIAG